jgi:hypothetical protein
MMDRSSRRDRNKADAGKSGTLLFGVDKQIHNITVQQLSDGALLLDLVRAVVLMRDGHGRGLPLRRTGSMLTLSEQDNHLEIDIDGAYLAGLIHDARSPRSPLQNNGRSYFVPLTTQLPADHQRTIERLATIFRHGSDETPWITTALWSENGQLTTPGNWDSFLEHGGWMIERLLIDIKPALRGYQRAHALSDTHVALIESVYARKHARTNDWLLLTQDDFNALVSSGHAGFQASNDLLLAHRIHQPYRPS